MKSSLCGANCNECLYKTSCKGCTETNGCPFGKQCFVAKYILTGGMDSYRKFNRELIDEINSPDIPGMEEVTELYPLVGKYVNLEYPLSNGGKVKLLCDDEMYLGAQVHNIFDDSGSTCFGVVTRADFLLVCEYGANSSYPELVLYKRR